MFIQQQVDMALTGYSRETWKKRFCLFQKSLEAYNLVQLRWVVFIRREALFRCDGLVCHMRQCRYSSKNNLISRVT